MPDARTVTVDAHTAAVVRTVAVLGTVGVARGKERVGVVRAVAARVVRGRTGEVLGTALVAGAVAVPLELGT